MRRATALIFVEHDFLTKENRLLNERVSLLEHSGNTKDNLIQSLQSKIDILNEINSKKDTMLTNNDAMLSILKKQIADEQRRRKKAFWYGAGVGAIVVGIVVVVK